MSVALYPALIFTVALLVISAYFLLSSMPLLILKHDTPLDSRFIRGFFNTYYLAVMFAATAGAVSYAFARRPVFAIGAAALAILAKILHRQVIGKMDLLRSHIQAGHTGAIPGFRRTHVTAIVLNLTQLMVVIWSLTTFSL